jgi:steroid delta-isomerase-like uncharacterized protein
LRLFSEAEKPKQTVLFYERWTLSRFSFYLLTPDYYPLNPERRTVMTRVTLVICLFAGVLIFAGCTDQEAAKAKQTAEANKAIQHKVYDAFNAGNFDALDALLATDVVDHNPDPGQKPGLAGVKEAIGALRTSFPDLKFTVEDCFAVGDKVAARVTLSGTQSGEFQGMPASGKSFSVQLIDIVRYADGKAVERWGNFDTMTFMQQLGMMPAPEMEKEKAAKK